jgi:hypothetical protein
MRGVELFDLWLFACMVPSLWKGGGPERIAALLVAVTALSTKLSVESLHLGYRSASPIVVAIDVVLAAALFLLALKANRMWTMLLASLQLCVVLAHVAKLAISQLDPLAYYIILTKWAYLIALMPVVGAVRHQLRMRAFLVDRSWSPAK